MKVTNITEADVLRVNKMLSANYVVCQKSNESFVPLLRPRITHSQFKLTITDELGYELVVLDNSDIFISENNILIIANNNTSVIQIFSTDTMTEEYLDKYVDKIARRFRKSLLTTEIMTEHLSDKNASRVLTKIVDSYLRVDYDTAIGPYKLEVKTPASNFEVETLVDFINMNDFKYNPNHKSMKVLIVVKVKKHNIVIEQPDLQSVVDELYNDLLASVFKKSK